MGGYDYVPADYMNYNDSESHQDDWYKASNAGLSLSDPMWPRVIVDAKGSKEASFAYTAYHNTESYVTKRETIVKNVHTPMVSHEYKYSCPTKVELFKHYGVNHVRTPMVTNMYNYESPTKVELFNEDKWHRPSSSVSDHLPEVEELISRIQSEVTAPAKITSLSSPTNWRNSPYLTGQNDSTGHGEYRKFSERDLETARGNNIRYENTFAESYRRVDKTAEPTAIGNGCWERQRHDEWPAPPSHPLTRATNNIDEAVELLKGAIKASSVTAAAQQPRFGETDSREAARRYAQPVAGAFRTAETYKATINNRDAMKKYNGTFVP